MRRTPRIPDEFRSFSPAKCPYRHEACLGSRNVYELNGLRNEPKLFGQEIMVDRKGREVIGVQYRGETVDWRFGDWDCDLLFLMKDAAPRTRIEERLGRHPDAFSARNFIEEPGAGGAPTNRNLHKFARPFGCRKLAGSVMIGILKPGESYSGPIDDLLNCPWIRDYCARVLYWVLHAHRTPKLKLVACLGEDAFDFVSDVLRVPKEERARLKMPGARGSTTIAATVHRSTHKVRIAYSWHPQPQAWCAIGTTAVENAWRRMIEESDI